VKTQEHGLLLDPEYGGRFHCRGRADPQGLPDQAPFTKKLTRTQEREYRFLALSRDDGDLHLARLNKIDRVRGVSLRKGSRVFLEMQYVFARDNVLQQVLDMRVDFSDVELCDLPGFFDELPGRHRAGRR